MLAGTTVQRSRCNSLHMPYLDGLIMILDVSEKVLPRAKMMLISATDHAADVRILRSAVLGDGHAEEPVQIEQIQAERSVDSIHPRARC